MDHNRPELEPGSSDQSILSELGHRLATERINRNQTQEALAKEAGISTSTVRRLESGRSTQLTAFLRVLRALGLLANLDALVPIPTISPLETLDRGGKPRQRASSPRKTGPNRPWAWGDEQ